MQNPPQPDPVHNALLNIAECCIGEGLVDEADTMLRFLELIDLRAHNLSLLQVWSLTQRGQVLEALRLCEANADKEPQFDGFLPLLALLRYTAGDQRWRQVCDQLLESDQGSEAGRVLARSLIDGSFGKEPPADRPGGVATEASAPDSTVSDYVNFVGMVRA